MYGDTPQYSLIIIDSVFHGDLPWELVLVVGQGGVVLLKLVVVLGVLYRKHNSIVYHNYLYIAISRVRFRALFFFCLYKKVLEASKESLLKRTLKNTSPYPQRMTICISILCSNLWQYSILHLSFLIFLCQSTFAILTGRRTNKLIEELCS